MKHAEIVKEIVKIRERLQAYFTGTINTRYLKATPGGAGWHMEATRTKDYHTKSHNRIASFKRASLTLFSVPEEKDLRTFEQMCMEELS